MMDLDLDFVLCCYTEVEEEQVVVHDWNVPQNEIRCFDWDPLFRQVKKKNQILNFIN